MIESYHHIQRELAAYPGAALVAVSKNATVLQIKELYGAGCRDFAESRVQTALEKLPNLPSDIRWHFIGRLQRNKINKILGKFFLIHSIDSFDLAEELAKKSRMADLETSVLLQVNIMQEKAKQGFTEEECLSQFVNLSSLHGIKILGLMTMAKEGAGEHILHDCFKRLFLLREALRKEIKDDAILPYLSMGMSQDYRIALEEGANLIRIGSSIFGR